MPPQDAFFGCDRRFTVHMFARSMSLSDTTKWQLKCTPAANSPEDPAFTVDAAKQTRLVHTTTAACLLGSVCSPEGRNVLILLSK